MSYLDFLVSQGILPETVGASGSVKPGRPADPLKLSGSAQNSEQNPISNPIPSHVGRMASHLVNQLRVHEKAIENTDAHFAVLLDDLETLAESFREAFISRGVSPARVNVRIDADRSVGILNILWHSVSFMTRNNTQPLALSRGEGQSPEFTGRMIALHGDFHELIRQVNGEEYPGIFQFEVASLYVPSDETRPAVMKIKHRGDEEHHFNQAEASRMFLLKTVEMICGGGVFHEKWF